MSDNHTPGGPPAATTSQSGASLALFTDLYQLTMLQAYHAEAMEADAVFSLFVRRLPRRRNYLLACGLETVLDYLEGLRFSDDDIAYLASLDRFAAPFLEWLGGFRFTGEVFAVAEGTPVFANEPILEIKAPISEAQLVETFVMNQIHVQTVLASKAARVVEAAQGRPVIDFGARRMHGIDAANKAARAFYIAGVAATSNMLAGKAYGLPVAGTMAHSYIQAHADEAHAFRAFVDLYPQTVLLVDTYDTEGGVARVIELAESLGEAFQVSAIRLDSGDLAALAGAARRRLDAAGLARVGIFASGGLDEDAVAALVQAGAPIDGFGVGTKMGVSSDAPDLDIAYKLCEYAGEGRLKLSPGKPILPGRKQVFRLAEDGVATGDVIARAEESLPGEPLLSCAMRGGKRTGASPSLEAIRDHARAAIAKLPRGVRALEPADPPYPVRPSEALDRYHDAVAAPFADRGGRRPTKKGDRPMARPQDALRDGDALLIVDVQNDFCPGGALPIAGGDAVVPVLNRWIDAAEGRGVPVYASRDWHPAGHMSFAEAGGPWPPHCVQDTEGAAFHPRLRLPAGTVKVTKGVRFDQDQYSAFDATGLADQLRKDGVGRLWVGGLAEDVCVRASVLDGVKQGFEIVLIEDATRPVTPEGGTEADREMKEAGARFEATED